MHELTDLQPRGAVPEERAFYTRRSSGLVREMSLSANVATAMLFMSPPLAVLTLTAGPSALPGANPFWTNAAAAFLALAPAALWAYFLVLMPRSGGDYVFSSRTLHPFIGFLANFSFMAWVLIAGVVTAQTTASFGVSAMFASLGALNHSASLTHLATDVTTKGWSLVSGLVILALGTIVLTLSFRRMMLVMKVLLGISLLGLVIAFFVLLFNDRSDFVHAVAANGGNYDHIIAAAHAQEGYSYGATSLKNIFLAVPLGFAAFGYSFLAVYAGSEIRSPRTSGRRAIFLALAIFAVIILPITALAIRDFGDSFLGASTVLSNAGSKAYTLGAPAFPFYYISMLASSNVLTVIMDVCFIVALISLWPVSLLIVSRSLFAWSFDRVVPTKLSEVDKRGTPLWANLTILVASVIFLLVSVYGAPKLISLLLSAGLAQQLTFIVLGVAGIVFPFRKKAIYERSPVRKSLLGIPVMSIVAVAATLVWGFVLYGWVKTKDLGANTTTAWITLVVILGLGALIYLVSWLVNRSQGVDLGLAFKELPPE
jgi:APA family basic amino acid/polyamine antiporter